MFNTTGVEESWGEITLAHTVKVKKMGWTHQWASSNVLCTCDMKTILAHKQSVQTSLSATMMQVLNQKKNYTMFL